MCCCCFHILTKKWTAKTKWGTKRCQTIKTSSHLFFPISYNIIMLYHDWQFDSLSVKHHHESFCYCWSKRFWMFERKWDELCQLTLNSTPDMKQNKTDTQHNTSETQHINILTGKLSETSWHSIKLVWIVQKGQGPLCVYR